MRPAALPRAAFKERPGRRGVGAPLLRLPVAVVFAFAVGSTTATSAQPLRFTSRCASSLTAANLARGWIPTRRGRFNTVQAAGSPHETLRKTHERPKANLSRRRKRKVSTPLTVSSAILGAFYGGLPPGNPAHAGLTGNSNGGENSAVAMPAIERDEAEDDDEEEEEESANEDSQSLSLSSTAGRSIESKPELPETGGPRGIIFKFGDASLLLPVVTWIVTLARCSGPSLDYLVYARSEGLLFPGDISVELWRANRIAALSALGAYVVGRAIDAQLEKRNLTLLQAITGSRNSGESSPTEMLDRNSSTADCTNVLSSTAAALDAVEDKNTLMI